MATAKDKRAAARAALASFKPSDSIPLSVDTGPKTGPGLLLRGVAVNAELEEENKLLKTQIASWDGDAHARFIDAEVIDDSTWANRHESSFAGPEFADLKAEIASAGRNVQPIKVRAKADGRFEIVFGHRRARACKELGLPVLAIIAEQMDEISLFVEMDRENRQREDLSPWEQGVMYRRALEKGLFPSQRKLAEALGVDVSNAGKCLALASLPDGVIRAFGSPLDIQLRWGGKLAKAYELDPDGVLAIAKRVTSLSPRPKSSEIFFQLVGVQGGGSEPLSTKTAKVAVKKDGSALIKLPAGTVAEADLVELQRLIDDFVKRKTG